MEPHPGISRCDFQVAFSSVISCIAQFTLFLADSKAKKSIEDRLITWYFKMEGFNWNEIAWWTVQKAENALDRFLGQQLFLPKAFLR